MPLDVLDVQALRRWVITARATLSEHAGDINALNVFPVPDRDTGTNMSVTMELAVDGLAAEAPADLLTSVRVLARATVVSARGNSGVILSQLVRGLADVVIALDGAPLAPSDVADVLHEAARRAREGVRAPVEGTMLSVADAAAAAASGARDGSLAELVDVVVSAAQDAVGRTRDQLPVLREAGVVDAGAVGYWLVLRALQHVVRREPGTVLEADMPQWLRPPERQCPTGSAGPGETVADFGSPGGDGGSGGPAYELMFLLQNSDDARVAVLAAELEGLGDSVVVGGGPEVWSLHVHLDDVAAGVNAAVAAGMPDRFQLTRFADQRPEERAAATSEPPSATSPIVALLASPGLSDVVRASDSAARVLTAPDTAAIERVVAAAGEHFLLADTAQLQARARRAAPGRSGSYVCESAHPAQLLAALAVRPGHQDIDSLRRVCDSAAVAVTTHTVENSSADDTARCRQLLDEVVALDVELITLIAGAEAPDGLLDSLTTHLADTRADVEVATFVGRRPGVVLDLGCE